MVDRLGEQLGNYRLNHLLGRGNFADVFLGQHIYLQTQAAIKLLHERLTSSDVDRFLSEARIIAHLRHPHIIQILDFGVENATPFLVHQAGEYAARAEPRGLAQRLWYRHPGRKCTLAEDSRGGWNNCLHGAGAVPGTSKSSQRSVRVKCRYL
ncbi:MAG: hypothetical protein E6I79_11945 [Chloroflexi bacterium]|nr:MAG: hypothetical protein E6I79_11945 [Chloroflexota bacterium]